ncbi:MAG: DUF4167 domain-containing protein [Beijerinckiaceae bacterium]
MRGGRGNNSGRRGPNPLTRSYESNGPDVKVRGTPQHIAEKYVQLARDAHSASDTVMAESYLQHAEHYYRIIAAAQAAQQQAYNIANGIPAGEAEQLEDEDEFEVAGADRFTFRTPQSFQQGGFNGQNNGYGQQPFQQGQPYNGDPAGADQPPMGDAQPGSGGEGGQQQPYQQPRGARQQQFGTRRFDERNTRRFGRDRGDRPFGGDRQGQDGRPQGDRPFGDRPQFQPRAEQPAPSGDDQPVLPSFITGGGRSGPAEQDGAPAPGGDDQQTEAGFRPRRRRRGRSGGGDVPPGEDGGPAEE